MILFTQSKFWSHHHNVIHTQKWSCSHLPNFECVWPSALYLRLLTTPITSHLVPGWFFAMYCVAQCSVMLPHGMSVTGTDCTQMPGIGRTFSGYSSMITSSIRVACWNSQFRGTHKFLRVHHVFEETLLSVVCAGQSQWHARPGWQVLVTVSPTRTNARAHPSLCSHPSGHGEFSMIACDTSLT
jgi:hypothetical protein